MIPSIFTHAQGFNYLFNIGNSQIYITFPELSSEQ